jgi:hypothetical protein
MVSYYFLEIRKIQILNSTTTISFSCVIAPSALHRLRNSEHRELATVRAAKRSIQSTFRFRFYCVFLSVVGLFLF